MWGKDIGAGETMELLRTTGVATVRVGVIVGEGRNGDNTKSEPATTLRPTKRPAISAPRGLILGFLYAFDDVLVQPFVPNGAVVRLGVGVLLRLTGLDVLDHDTPFFNPDQQVAADVF